MVPWDWNAVADRSVWLEPCEESYYYARKWKKEGRRSVLDLGCGLGRHALLFAECGFKTTAVDISPEAIDSVKKSCRENGLDLLAKVADMTSLPFADDAFDCIFAMHSAGHCDTPGMAAVMKEIRRVLKPGGAIYLSLCSKETWSYLCGNLPRIDENTLIKTDGPEQGVPHFFADSELIKELFRDFELIRVRHTDDCCFNGKWGLQKHYFIEAVLNKEPARQDYSGIIGRKVSCTVDRPLGSAHPRAKSLVYPINYGYVDGVLGGDGAEQDVYILGINEPLERFEGKVIAVYHRLNDNEDKWVVAPEGSEPFSEQEILSAIDFQEKFFDGLLYIR